MNLITIKPAKDRTVTDENGKPITAQITVDFSEYWARRIIDGDVIIIKQKGTQQ